jgi:hypothetical protein
MHPFMCVQELLFWWMGLFPQGKDDQALKVWEKQFAD